MKLFIISLIVLIAGAFSQLKLSADEITVLDDVKGYYRSMKKFCIVANVDDIKIRKAIEDTLNQRITQIQKIFSYSSYKIFPPSRKWSEKQILRRLSQMKVEAIIKVYFVKQDSLLTDSLSNDNGKLKFVLKTVDKQDEVWAAFSNSEFPEIDENLLVDEFGGIAEDIVKYLYTWNYIFDCGCGNRYDRFKQPKRRGE